MVAPGLVAVLTPVAVGFLLGKETLGGMLVGATAMGAFLALFMANGGGAWDNAKKYIEAGNLGGKGSDNHKATVVGDTVGDPFKDTSGPAMNILIKLMSVVSLVISPVLPVMGLFLR
jgi:K(+)-stimulated pyrophosphate-energized sodium pump